MSSFHSDLYNFNNRNRNPTRNTIVLGIKADCSGIYPENIYKVFKLTPCIQNVVPFFCVVESELI